MGAIEPIAVAIPREQTGIDMFEGSKKKASAQTRATQQKPALGIMGRAGGAAAKKPAAGSGSDAARPAAETAQRSQVEETVTIGAAATIRGDITGKGDLVISGRVEGTVDLPENNANLEATGFMDGGILAKNVNIRGKVQGDIEARRKVTIYATGAVIGTILAPRIQIEDGARFKGRIDMTTAKPAAAPKPKKAAAPAPPAKATTASPG